MEREKSYLFVYGTLRSALSSPVSHLVAGDIEWKGSATIHGELYDIGDYPGAVPSDEANSIIRGELIQILRPENVLKILDEYEGCNVENDVVPEYVRKKQQVKSGTGAIIEAWVYWYNLPVTDKRRISGNDYLKYLRKKQLA